MKSSDFFPIASIVLIGAALTVFIKNVLGQTNEKKELFPQTWHRNTNKILSFKMNPILAKRTAETINEFEKKGRYFIVSDGYRSYVHQAAIYAQGRESLESVNSKRKIAGLYPIKSADNKRVTNAKPGFSHHNFGLAVDIYEVERSTESPNKASKLYFDNWRFKDFYEEMNEGGRGFKWGASFQDFPHIWIDFGMTLSQLRKEKSRISWLK